MSCGATPGVTAAAGACEDAGGGPAEAIAKCSPRLWPACNTKAICDAANAAASCYKHCTPHFNQNNRQIRLVCLSISNGSNG